MLYNSGEDPCVITRLTLRGEPFALITRKTVQDVDPSVADDVDHVQRQIDGKYATSVDQVAATLNRNVAMGRIRTRHFELQSPFVPLLQRGMGCVLVTQAGEEVRCTLSTYAHKPTGSTLATMRTSVVLDEIVPFIPSHHPTVFSSPSVAVVPRKGEQGEMGPPGEDAYQVHVISDQGTVFRMGSMFFATLQARVWRGGVEITEAFTDSDFRWMRTSGDAHGDEVWNSHHYATGGRTLTISQDDVAGRSVFNCDLLRERS